ncbi:PDZ domain-containing protein [Candidatus Dojkabacteria bacterium]|nr:PDZ domain-containing protein [Candidatus Dojkabacteria bacterium]
MKKKKYLLFLVIVILVTNFVSGFSGLIAGVAYTKYEMNRNGENGNLSTDLKIVDSNDAVVEVVENSQDAVVSIIVTKDLPVYEEFYYNPSPFGDDFFDYFFRRKGRRQIGEEEQEVGAGTGFIVSSDGYIVTNKHVVQDEEASYTVVFNDGDKIDAEILARDPLMDIAVIKVARNDLNYLSFGDSDNLKVGQKVVAIGNALGQFSNSVSSGIISGLARSITAGSRTTGKAETLTGVIQTDASINPGNSGGPLLDLSGNVIGMNVAMAQAENIGFAIPSNSVQKVVESVKEHGKIVRPYIGVRYVPVTPELQEANNLKVDYGALVIRGETPEELAVIPGGPADKAGIQENDIILEINGKKIDENARLDREIQKYSVGEVVELKILHKGEEKTVNVTLEAYE